MRLLIAGMAVLACSTALADDCGVLVGIMNQDGEYQTCYFAKIGVSIQPRLVGKGLWARIPNPIDSKTLLSFVYLNQKDNQFTYATDDERLRETWSPALPGYKPSITFYSGNHLCLGWTRDTKIDLGVPAGYISYRIRSNELLPAPLETHVQGDLVETVSKEASQYFSKLPQDAQTKATNELDLTKWGWSFDEGQWTTNLHYKPLDKADPFGPSVPFLKIMPERVEVKNSRFWSGMKSFKPDPIAGQFSEKAEMGVGVYRDGVEFLRYNPRGSVSQTGKSVKIQCARLVSVQWFFGEDIRKLSVEVARLKAPLGP